MPSVAKLLWSGHCCYYYRHATSVTAQCPSARTAVDHHHHHHHHHLICKQLKQIITAVQYIKDIRHNQAETAPTVALDTTNTSIEQQKINKAIQSKK